MHEYTASDKTVLLEHYKNFRKQFQEAELSHKKIEEMNAAKKNEEPKKPQYLHLKHKLKPHHHLLQSLVIVEELEANNTQTFFDISFGQMKEKL